MTKATKAMTHHEFWLEWRMYFFRCTSNVIIIVKTCTIFINWLLSLRKRSRTNKMKFVLSRARMYIAVYSVFSCLLALSINILMSWMTDNGTVPIDHFSFALILNWTRINYLGNFGTRITIIISISIRIIMIIIQPKSTCFELRMEKITMSFWVANKMGKFIKWNIANRFVVSHVFSYFFFVLMLASVYLSFCIWLSQKRETEKKECLWMIQMSFKRTHLWIWIIVT